MRAVHCRVAHEPENGLYGDCVRACVASLMEKQSEDVPHFFHDNCDGLTGARRMAEWLEPLGFVPFFTGYDPSSDLGDIMFNMEQSNPTVHYVLFGGTDDGDHAVICRGGEILFNPSWYGCRITGPNSSGQWLIMVIAKL